MGEVDEAAAIDTSRNLMTDTPFDNLKASQITVPSSPQKHRIQKVMHHLHTDDHQTSPLEEGELENNNQSQEAQDVRVITTDSFSDQNKQKIVSPDRSI